MEIIEQHLQAQEQVAACVVCVVWLALCVASN